MNTRVYTHIDCYDHQPGSGHPEAPQRLAAVLEALKASEFAALDWQQGAARHARAGGAGAPCRLCRSHLRSGAGTRPAWRWTAATR